MVERPKLFEKHTKVTDFDVKMLVEQYIVRLDIPMNDIFLMKVGNSAEHHVEQRSSHDLIQRS